MHKMGKKMLLFLQPWSEKLHFSPSQQGSVLRPDQRNHAFVCVGIPQARIEAASGTLPRLLNSDQFAAMST